MKSPILFFKTRKFRYFFAPLAILWVVWFGLSKYFYAQDTKEVEIPNPIKAVPADSEFYAQKRKVKPGLWILTTEIQDGRVQDKLVDWTPFHSNIENQHLLKLYEKFFYKPKPFIDGGWFQSSVYSAPLEGLKYCRIGLKQTNFNGMVGSTRLQFQFDPVEEPCVQPKEFGGKFPNQAYIYAKNKNIFYLNFTGYLQAHVNNYDDFKAYIYRCEKTSGTAVTCKLLGYDQDALSLQEQFEEKARKNGSLVPLRLWN